MIAYLKSPVIPRGGQGQAIGSLYTSNRPEELGQDMVEVSFPSGAMIAAGWVPEGDPDGTYEVAVSRGLTLIEPLFTTRNVHEAQSFIQSKVNSLSFNCPRFTSDSVSAHLVYGRSSIELVNA